MADEEYENSLLYNVKDSERQQKHIPSNEIIQATRKTSLSPFRNLLSSTHLLNAQLKEQLTFPSVIHNCISSSDLINQINIIFKRQMTINTLSSQISQQNHLTNIATYAKAHQMSDIINRGYKEILILSRTVTNLKQTIANLNTDIESQRIECKLNKCNVSTSP